MVLATPPHTVYVISLDLVREQKLLLCPLRLLHKGLWFVLTKDRPLGEGLVGSVHIFIGASQKKREKSKQSD